MAAGVNSDVAVRSYSTSATAPATADRASQKSGTARRFDSIHKASRDKAENLLEYRERKQARQRQLLAGSGVSSRLYQVNSHEASVRLCLWWRFVYEVML